MSAAGIGYLGSFSSVAFAINGALIAVMLSV